MDLKSEFEAAVVRSKELRTRPDNESLLALYALYKQATEGDVTGERPGGFDFKAIAKHDAWAARRGMTAEDAMKAYASLVEDLHRQNG